MRKVTLNGALKRSKMRNALVHEIANLPLSTEGLNGVTLDDFILRARKIDATLTKGESL